MFETSRYPIVAGLEEVAIEPPRRMRGRGFGLRSVWKA
jgi:hypothetical protein